MTAGRAAMRAPAALLAVALGLLACGPDGSGADGGATGGAAGAARGGGGGAGGGAAGDAAAPGGGGRAAAPDLGHANVIIISLDTLRADAVSMLGGPDGISPALARFASECVLFRQARSQAPHTAPSHMTLFTSTFPSVHGVQNVAFDKDEAGAKKATIVPLPASIPTLAEVLTAAGFRSIGLTDGGNLNPPHGFDRGFEHYTYALAGAEAQVDDALPWIEQLAAPGAVRFFLFWHTYQVHAPYVPPDAFLQRWAPADYDGLMKARIAQLQGKSFKERFGLMKDVFWKDRDTFGPPEARYLRGLYNGNVAFTDSQVDRLLEALRKSGALETSIVVLLSDHGEEFFEHGRWQHEQVYEECLRVPLMVRLPGQWGAGRQIDTPVGLIDVMPTLLDLLALDTGPLALPGPVRHDGQSFAKALLDNREPEPRPIVSELIASHGGNLDWQIAVHVNGMTAIFDELRGERLPDKSVRYVRMLFDLRSDPEQAHDLVPGGSDKLPFFEQEHLHFLGRTKQEQASIGVTPAIPIPAGMLDQLEQLGYVGAGAAGASGGGSAGKPAPKGG